MKTDTSLSGEAQSHAAARAEREKKRDPRLDFFRGLGMFIILIAHIPWDSWNRWIPARFGYSDATEIFVFCSGAASAMAFLTLFETRGWWIGTARILWRIWQLYWCHIGVFFAVLTALVIVDGSGFDPTKSHVTTLNLARFVDDPAAFLPGLFSLSYVPNLFDILPMYMVILALLPVVIALSRWRGPDGRPWLVFAFSLGLWMAASQPWLSFIDVPVFQGLNLPAEPVGEARTWFFNPFAWQLVFFTGFAFAVGWLPAPPISPRLMWIAAAVLVISAPLDPDGVPIWRLMGMVEGLQPVVQQITHDTASLHSKSFFGLLRYVHFLCLAYLVWALAGERGAHLPDTGIPGKLVTIVRRVGQQSLAVFIASLVISRLLGVLMHKYDGLNTLGVTIAVNLLGFALLVAVAYTARYFRNPPWSKPR
ncbi:MAG: OpgC domain-containing protein [Neomegalonema sp.]|nr:OpgC domain-containing protein [Neomegalonema sp.]